MLLTSIIFNLVIRGKYFLLKTFHALQLLDSIKYR